MDQFKKTHLKAGPLLSPVPVVMVSVSAEHTPHQRPNIITVAWTGTINSHPPMLSIAIKPERYSYDLIKQAGQFVVNLVTDELLEACDFCGVKSGRTVDKFEHCHLTPEPIDGHPEVVGIQESPLQLVCQLKQAIELGSHTLFLCEIIDVLVASMLIDEQNALHLNRLRWISYMHGAYYGLSDCLGFFGYSIAKPSVKIRRMNKLLSESKHTINQPIKKGQSTNKTHNLQQTHRFKHSSHRKKRSTSNRYSAKR